MWYFKAANKKGEYFKVRNNIITVYIFQGEEENKGIFQRGVRIQREIPMLGSISRDITGRVGYYVIFRGRGSTKRDIYRQCGNKRGNHGKATISRIFQGTRPNHS
jgi:hypothetical protein